MDRKTRDDLLELHGQAQQLGAEALVGMKKVFSAAPRGSIEEANALRDCFMITAQLTALSVQRAMLEATK